MKTALLKNSLSLKNNRKFKVFMFFLVLTSIIWLLIELSKTYTNTVVFNIKYTNLSANKLLQNSPTSKLNLIVKSPGFSLLKYKIKTPKVTLNLNAVTKKGNLFFVLPNEQLSNFNTQLSGDAEVIGVEQDTIFIELGNNKSKKVPIKSKLDVKFKMGYNLIDKLKMTPDSVLITGSEKYVDSISEIFTTPLKLTEVYETINVKLKLDIPFKNNELQLSNTEVSVKGKVDKFTEDVFKIPVIIINEPEGVKINPFPKEIEVTYQVALSNFNKISENSIAIVFDYNQYKNDTLTRYLTPVIKQKSDFIHSLKINPTQIEFLIQK